MRAYNRDCDAHSRPWLTGKAFSGAIRRLRPNIDEAQRVVLGKVVWVWTALRLRDSLDSLDSLDQPYLLYGAERVEEEGEVQGRERRINNEANRVNRVNRVSASDTDWPETALFKCGESVMVDIGAEEVGPYLVVNTWVADDGRRMYRLSGIDGDWSQAALEVVSFAESVAEDIPFVPDADATLVPPAMRDTGHGQFTFDPRGGARVP